MLNPEMDYGKIPFVNRRKCKGAMVALVPVTYTFL